MKYFKDKKTGDVYAYEQSDIDAVGLITYLESQLEVLQRWLTDNPAPPKLETEDDGTVGEDEHSKDRAEYKQKQDEAEAIQSQLDSVLPVFFDIRDKLKSMVELTGVELDEHLNPAPTAEQLVGEAESQKSTLLSLATNKIEPLQDAVDLDIATDDELAQLKEWKKYRVLVNRVDTSLAPDVVFPKVPSGS